MAQMVAEPRASRSGLQGSLGDPALIGRAAGGLLRSLGWWAFLRVPSRAGDVRRTPP